MVNSVFYRNLCLVFLIFLITANISEAQTKRIKRPRGSVGIRSIDNFVKESFDLYEKVYRYDGYAASGTPLEDEDIDVLEEASDDVLGLTESTPDIISDLDGENMLTQAKATLRINRAKKALKYSIKTTKKLLLGEDTDDDNEDEAEADEDNMDDKESDNSEHSSGPDEASIDKIEETPSNVSDNLEVLGKFDFVSGDKVIFNDDFSKEYVGDFPSKWNTNASGEIVKVDGQNWFELKSGNKTFYIPDLKIDAEDYTIEFDLLTKGIDRKTSSVAGMAIIISDQNDFNYGSKHHVSTWVPFVQFTLVDIRLENYFNGDKGKIKSGITTDIRDEILNQPHISIAVTKQRYRLWINEVKYVDVPRFVEELDVLNSVKLNLSHFKDGKERVFITNFKVAEGGVDLRRQLLSEGKISTNGILFNSGSSKIKKQSYGIIKQISQVLQQDNTIKLKIVGHTDADGDESNNLTLSKSRAAAVKNALIEIYKIDESRLNTNGKGESEAIADNKTSAGKAENRRVEFILQ